MKNIRALKQIGSQLLIIMNKCQRWQSVLLIISLFISAILEMFGIGIVIPMIMAVLQPNKLFEYKIIDDYFTVLGIDKNRNNIIILISGVVILIYIIKNLFAILVSYYQFRFRNHFFRDLSVHIMKNYMKKPYAYFLGINSSEIIRGIESDSSNITQMVDDFCELISICFILTIMSVFLIWLDPILTIVLLFSISIASFIIIMSVKGKVHKWGVKQRETIKRKTQCCYQTIHGIKDITVMNRRQNFMEEYIKASYENCKCYVKYQFIQSLPNRCLETIFIIVLIIILIFCSFTMDDITIFLAKLSAFALASMKILPQLSLISSDLNTLIFYKESLHAIYAEEVEKNVMCVEGKHEEEVEVLDENWKELKINGISWKYGENMKYIFENLSFVIKKGTSIAFIGESGSGKTTLADILLGLLQPSEGAITLDSINIFNVPTKWAAMVGYVPQSIFLIDGTIRDNIVFGVEVRDDQRVWDAIEQAQLTEFVLSLPMGIETMVGERGIKLSGGQRQRIAIARAMFYNPEILVLDEATAALDNETEDAIMEAINKFQGKKTLIVIAHRLTTIKNCDQIYEVINGGIRLKTKQEVGLT